MITRVCEVVVVLVIVGLLVEIMFGDVLDSGEGRRELLGYAGMLHSGRSAS